MAGVGVAVGANGHLTKRYRHPNASARVPAVSYPTGRKASVGHTDKCSDRTGYKQTNKKSFPQRYAPGFAPQLDVAQVECPETLLYFVVTARLLSAFLGFLINLS